MGEHGSIGERRKDGADPVESQRGREGRLRASSRQRAPPAREERRSRRRERRSNPLHHVGGRYPAPWILLAGGRPEPDRCAREQGREEDRTTELPTLSSVGVSAIKPLSGFW
jgi:hypothetical protein